MWCQKKVSWFDYRVFSICHFYGYKYEYVLSMDSEVFNQAYDMIQILEKKQFLSDIKACSYPYLELKARNQTYKKAFDIAYPQFFKENMVASDNEIDQFIRMTNGR